MHRGPSRYAAEGETDSALVIRHGPLIDRIARRIAARTAGAVSADDLWSAGAMGLLDAAHRFDPARDVKFETFVEHRIRGAMLDELRRLDHVPRRMRQQAESIERTRNKLAHEKGREPSTEELAEAEGISSEDLVSIQAVAQPPVTTFDDLTTQLIPPDEEAARAQMSRALASAIAELPERLQLVLSLHYVEGLTYREIAKILEVSEPRICQLQNEAIAKLRAALNPPP